jgi:hypothetical protein
MLIITNPVEYTKQHLPSRLIKIRFKILVNEASHL